MAKKIVTTSRVAKRIKSVTGANVALKVHALSKRSVPIWRAARLLRLTLHRNNATSYVVCPGRGVW